MMVVVMMGAWQKGPCFLYEQDRRWMLDAGCWMLAARS